MLTLIGVRYLLYGVGRLAMPQIRNEGLTPISCRISPNEQIPFIIHFIN